MFKWFFFSFEAHAICSILAGLVEKAYLGSYSAQAVWYPFFNFFAQMSKANIITGAVIVWNSVGPVFGSFVKMFTWNYVILQDGMGAYLKFGLLWPLSAALILFTVLAFFGKASS